jgi:hypothetical protein
MNKLYFREVQRYTQWWVWLLLLVSFAIAVIPLWYGVYIQSVEDRPWGDEPITTVKLVVVATVITLFMASLVTLFGVLKLETEVFYGGFRYRYYPFIPKWRVIYKADILHCNVGKYSPIASYGGWGIRKGSMRKEKVYTISGNMALTIKMLNSTNIIIGTNRKDAIKYAMEKMMQAKVANRNRE